MSKALPAKPEKWRPATPLGWPPPFFGPEGRRKLAGGASHRFAPTELQSPGGASDSRRNPHERSTVAALLMLVLVLLAPLASGQETAKELKPPFGLNWGETTDHLQRLLDGVKAKVVGRRAVDADHEAWDVEGLLQTGLKRTVFTFRKGEL